MEKLFKPVMLHVAAVIASYSFNTCTSKKSNSY